nr:uncharacterized protein LOC111986004 [Quercus suber]POE84644.1 heavy metal-associated isoprenylated plant protein 35 [Quercus suber]
MSCTLKVDTQSPGWHTTLSKVLMNIKGLSYEIDAKEGVAHVYGKVEPKILLKKIQKAGKKAELVEVHSEDPYANGDTMYGHNYESFNDFPYYNYVRTEPPPYQSHHYPNYQPHYYEPHYYEPMAYYPHHRSYEPPAQLFPQPPSPMKIDPFYDPDYSCSIM